MKFRQSTLVLSLVLAPFFIASYVSPARSAVPTTTASRQAATLQRYATNLQSSRNRLPELKAFIEKQDWGEVQSFIRGPLGELEVRLNRLKTSLPSSQQSPLERRINSLSQHLNQIDASAGKGNSQLALEQYQAFENDFDSVFKQLDIPIIAPPKNTAPSIPSSTETSKIPAQKIAKVEQSTSPPSVQTSNPKPVSSETSVPKPESLSITPPPTNKQSPTRVSTNSSPKDVIPKMDAEITPPYGFIAFFALLIFTIFLQIRYQFTRQCLNTQVELLKQGKPLPTEMPHQLKVEQPYQEGSFQPPTAEDLPQVWNKLTKSQSTQTSFKDSLQTPEVMKIVDTIAAVFAATITPLNRLFNLNSEQSAAQTGQTKVAFKPLTGEYFKQILYKRIR